MEEGQSLDINPKIIGTMWNMEWTKPCHFKQHNRKIRKCHRQIMPIIFQKFVWRYRDKTDLRPKEEDIGEIKPKIENVNVMWSNH